MISRTEVKRIGPYNERIPSWVRPNLSPRKFCNVDLLMSDLIFGRWAASSTRWSLVNICFVGSKSARSPQETSPNDADEFSHEYDIIKSVVRVAFKLPTDFPDLIGDLVQKLVVSPHGWISFLFPLVSPL